MEKIGFSLYCTPKKLVTVLILFMCISVQREYGLFSQLQPGQPGGHNYHHSQRGTKVWHVGAEQVTKGNFRRAILFLSPSFFVEKKKSGY